MGKILGVIFLLSLLFSPDTVCAEPRFKIYGLEQAETLFKFDNIYPGFSAVRDITFENTSSKKEQLDIFMSFSLDVDSTLAQSLQLTVVRNSDKSVRIGADNKMTLKKAAEIGRIFVDRLSPKEKEKYRLEIKFDPEADNGLQNQKIDFDINFTFIEKVVNSQGSASKRIKDFLVQPFTLNQTDKFKEKVIVNSQNEEDQASKVETAGARQEQEFPKTILKQRNTYILIIVSLLLFLFILTYVIKRKKLFNNNRLV